MAQLVARRIPVPKGVGSSPAGLSFVSRTQALAFTAGCPRRLSLQWAGSANSLDAWHRLRQSTALTMVQH